MTDRAFPHKKNHRKRNLILALLLAAAVVAAAGIVWAMSGNQGVVTDAPARKAAPPVQQKLYDGKYIQFYYKGVYSVHRPSSLGTDLELATLSANTNYEKYLAVAVSPLPHSKLENNSNFNMRKNASDTYASRTVQIDSGTAIVYTKGVSEQTAFIQHGDKVAVLAFTTTPSNLDNLQPEVDALLKTFRWKA